MIVPCSNNCGRRVRVRKTVKNLTRVLCGKCRQAAEMERKERYEKKRRAMPMLQQGGANLHKRVTEISPVRVAEILGTTVNAICRIERRALQKLRASAELRDYWALVKSEGLSGFSQPRRDPNRQLLEYLLQMDDFYETHDLLVGQGKREAALECRQMIAQCMNLIRREIRQLG